MLYIVGLGLNEKGISLEGKEAVKKCKKVYLEGYTVEFPYSIKKLEKFINRKITVLKREDVESDRLIKETKKQDIALLVYGSPLFATTHIGLLLECNKSRVKAKIVYSASIFDVIAETGLELYKFGKASSMPKWQEHFTPDSFLDYVEQNNSIDAHSLILVDIGLSFKDALKQLEIASKNKKLKTDKLVVCSLLGTDKAKVYYGNIKSLNKKKVNPPYCFIIPKKLHFLEKESLGRFEV